MKQARRAHHVAALFQGQLGQAVLRQAHVLGKAHAVHLHGSHHSTTLLRLHTGWYQFWTGVCIHCRACSTSLQTADHTRPGS